MRELPLQNAPNQRLQGPDRQPFPSGVASISTPPNPTTGYSDHQSPPSYDHFEDIQIDGSLSFRDSVNSVLNDSLLSFALAEADLVAVTEGNSSTSRQPHQAIHGHELTNALSRRREPARSDFLNSWVCRFGTLAPSVLTLRWYCHLQGVL
jgi:hypothetical protein